MKKLANGYGSITKNGGNRRKPYLVRVYIGGKQRCIGYCATYQEGLLLLAERQKNPAILNRSTVSDLYRLATQVHYQKVTKSSVTNYESAWKWCKPLYNKEITKIKYRDLQEFLDSIKDKVGYSVQKKIRSLFHILWKYAVRYEMVAHDCTKDLEIAPNITVTEKKPFNTRQINKVKELAKTDDMAKAVVILCYTGLRANEFLNLKNKDIKWGNKSFVVTKSKTKSGTGRIIPIHPNIVEYFRHFREQKHTYFFTAEGEKMEYHRFKLLFDRTMKSLNLHHTPHECRHTLATWLDEAEANETCTKLILGHSTKDITKGVYTHKTVSDLKKAMKKIK